MSREQFLTKYGAESGVVLNKKIIDVFCILTVIVVSALWAFLIFNKTAQPQEGWYIVYGNMILDGMVPYVDFEFLYLPLYAYLSAFLIFLFGDGLLLFRIVGVLLFIATAVVTFLIFKTVTPSWIAAVGSLITVFAFQGDVFFIFYDYHSVFILFAFLSIYFMLKAILGRSSEQENKTEKRLLLAGLLCSLATLIRPQSGIMLLIYFITFFVVAYFFVKRVKFSYRNICWFFVGFLIPVLLMCIFLIYEGAFSECIEMVFFGGTKGSISNMLVGWTDYIRLSLIYPPLILIPLLVYVSLKTDDAETSTDRLDLILYFSTILVVTIGIICAFYSFAWSTDLSRYHPISPVGSSWPSVFFVLGCTIFLAIFFKIIRHIIRNKDISSFDIASLFVGGNTIVIAIGAATSGPLPYVGAALLFGFVFVTLLHRCIELPRTKIKRGVELFSVAFVTFLIITIVAPKVITPYNWWGSSVSPYADAVYEADVDYFTSIWMSSDEKHMYEDFENQTNLYLGPSDELYCYANIPIFYHLANKTPTVKAVVPWFDVSRESTIREDLDYLKDNNPKMIIFNDHTMDAVNAHQELYGGKGAHHDLYSWLLECRDDPGSKYDVISTYYGTYNTYLLVLKPIYWP